MGDAYVFYGVASSYYSGKVRAYLRKKGLAFDERLPSVPEYRSEIRPLAGTHHIPVVRAPDGTVVQDSTLILDFLEARHPEKPALPANPRQRLAALMLEVFGQEGLTRPAMHYRWNFLAENRDYIVHDFGRSLRPEGSLAEIESAGLRVAEKMAAKLPGLGVTPRTVAAVEAQFLQMLQVLDAHFRRHPYLLGGAPTRADYGLMAPLYAHISRDPYPAQLLRSHAPAVARWIEQMNVPELAMPEFHGRPVELAQDDSLPDTLLPVLRLFVELYGPELIATAAAWTDWLAAHGGGEPGATIVEAAPTQPVLEPRTVEMGGVDFEIRPRLHSLWMFQRALDHHRAHEAACRDLVAACGADALMALTLPRPLRRDGARLVVG